MPPDMAPSAGYRYADASPGHHHGYLLPTVLETLDELGLPPGERRLFELGCGNGSLAHALSQRGWEVTGVDPSAEGIAQARTAYPDLKLDTGSAYDDLAARYGRFPVVLSLEVVEHVYAPRDYARTVFDLCKPGGGGDHLHPLPRLLEEPGPGADWEDGRPFHRPVGPRAHQVLVDEDLG